jgi:hypothetical protein
MQTSIEMSNPTLLTKIFLSQGLVELKKFISFRISEVSGEIPHYSYLDEISEEIDEMLSDPLDTIQDRVGYVEDIEYNDPRNTNLQEALVELSQDQEVWDSVNKSLQRAVKNSSEYKVLIDNFNEAYSRF